MTISPRVQVIWNPNTQTWLVTRGFQRLGAFDRVDQAQHFRASLEGEVIDLDAVADPETEPAA